MIEDMKSRLRKFSLEELEKLLSQRTYPSYVEDPRIFLAALGEVIKEKKDRHKALEIDPR
jgi:hypothetical protein